MWRRLALLCGALLVFGVSVARHLPYLDRPFGRDQLGFVSSGFGGLFAKNYARHGFTELRGMPVFALVPLDEPRPTPYLNHPPGYFWLLAGVTAEKGVNERALRWPSVIASGLFLALLSALAARRGGGFVGLAVALLGLAAPLAFVYGLLVNYEPLLLLLILLVAWERERVMARRKRGFALALLLALGLWIDWAVVFLFPALLLREFLLPRHRRRFRPLLRSAMAVGASGLLIVACLAWWALYSGKDLVSLFGVAVRATTESQPMTPPIWLDAAVDGLGDLFGLPFLLLAGAGLGVFLSRRVPRTVARLTLVLLVPGLLNPLVFPVRILDHAFWWSYLLPSALLLAALGLEALRRRAGLAAAGLVLALVTVHLASLSVRTWERIEDPGPRRFGEVVNALLGADDLVLTPDRLWKYAFYLEPHLIFDLEDPSRHLDVIERFLRGEFRAVDRLVVATADPDFATEGRLGKRLEEVGRRLPVPDAAVWVVSRPPRVDEGSRGG